MSSKVITTRVPGLETFGKIIGFIQYPNGWNYGTGQSPATKVVAAAFKINEAAFKAGLETDAFLSVDGEVRVTIYHRSTYLQFTVDERCLVEYVREEGNEELQRIIDLTTEGAISILEMFELELWRSSVSSTVTTTMPTGDVSKISHSKLPAAVRVFLSLSGIAPFELALQSADT